MVLNGFAKNDFIYRGYREGLSGAVQCYLVGGGFSMKKFTKSFLALVLAVSLCMALSINAYANQFRYINDLSGSNELTITSGKATMYSELFCSSDVTKVVMTHVLQKKSGSSYNDVPYSTFTKTFYNNHAPYMEDTATCTGYGTYRIKTTYVVTSPRGTDRHTHYSATETI